MERAPRQQVFVALTSVFNGAGSSLLAKPRCPSAAPRRGLRYTRSVALGLSRSASQRLWRFSALVTLRLAHRQLVAISVATTLVTVTVSWALTRGAPQWRAAPLFVWSLWPLAALRMARRRHPRRLDGVLALDRQLGAHAAVLTAAEWSLAPLSAPSPPVHARVLADAEEALARATWRDLGLAPLWRGLFVSAVMLALTVGALRVSIAPVPASTRPSERPLPSASAASIAAAAETLGNVAPEAPGHEAAAEATREARQLAHALEHAITFDAAQSRTEALEQRTRDARLWSRAEAHQRAREAALEALRAPSHRALADALSQGDLRALDEAVRQLADRREAAAQRAAAEALARAAEAAGRNGSSPLADALRDESALLQRRATASRLATAIARALEANPAGRRIAAHLQRSDDTSLSDALSETLRSLDGGLSEAERQRVAEALAAMSQQPENVSRAELERAARAMTEAEAREAVRQLIESLRRPGVERSPAGQAAATTAQAEGQIRQLRVRFQLERQGATASNPSNATPAAGNAAHTASSTPGGAPNGAPSANPAGPHAAGGAHIDSTGQTAAVHATGFMAPVTAPPNPSNPGTVVSIERSDTTGARAQRLDRVSLERAAPSAVEGVERMPVPAPWREQVRAYFRP